MTLVSCAASGSAKVADRLSPATRTACKTRFKFLIIPTCPTQLSVELLQASNRFAASIRQNLNGEYTVKTLATRNPCALNGFVLARSLMFSASCPSRASRQANIELSLLLLYFRDADHCHIHNEHICGKTNCAAIAAQS